MSAVNVKLTRGPNGELVTPFAAAVEKRADSMAAARGSTRVACYADAYQAVGQEQPELAAQHARLMAAANGARYRAALPQVERAAFAALERVENMAAVPVAAPRLPVTPAEEFLALVDKRVASLPRDRVDRYATAYIEAGKERPDLARAYKNRAQEDEPEEFGLAGAEPDMDELKAKARELARAIAKANGAEFDEAGFDLAFTDPDQVAAFMKRFQTQLAGVRLVPGGSGETTPVLMGEQAAARVGNPDKFASQQAAGAWSEPFAQYVAGQPFRIMPLGTFKRDGRTLDLTPARLKRIAANYEQGIPRWKAPIYAGHPDEKADPPALGHIARLEYVPGKGLYAHPAFTEEGAKLAGSGAYLYNSPGILWDLNGGGYVDENGNVAEGGALDHVALTSRPFFGAGNTLEQ